MSADSSDVGELDTDIIMRALAKKMLRMLVDDEYNDKNLCVFFDSKDNTQTDDGMIGVTIGISVGDLIVEKGAAETVDVAKKPIEEPNESKSTEGKPSTIGVKERISSARRKLRGVIYGLTRKKEKQPEQSSLEENNSIGNPFRRLNNENSIPVSRKPTSSLPIDKNSIGNPFAGNFEEDMTIENDKAERIQEYRNRLNKINETYRYLIQDALAQKDKPGKSQRNKNEIDKGIEIKQGIYEPTIENISQKLDSFKKNKIVSNADWQNIESNLLILEHGFPPQENIDKYKSRSSKITTELPKTLNPVENETKIAFRPNLIRKATRIAEKIEAALKGELATLNPTDRKKLDDNLFLLKTQRNMANDEDEDFDQGDKDRLQRLIAFFEKNYPKILADSEQIASAAATDSESFSQENPLLESKKQQLPSGVSSRIGFGQHMSRQGPGIGPVTQTKKTHQLRIGAPPSLPANPSGTAQARR